MARLWLLLLAALLTAAGSDAAGIGFEFHHRFSDRVRQWAEDLAIPGAWWPQKGTAEYYAALAHQDRALRGRSLADASASELTFADGNVTYLSGSLGFLHYAFVELGTPNVTFLVALDTGSDLFWVPCDCQQCASTHLVQGLELNVYSPSNSSTSQKVPCSNSLCDNPNACTGTNGSCPYNVQYLSANTSSSGFLVEDVLYLTTEDATPRIVEAPIVFGCGDRQSGAFLDGAAPNGLFGLGMEKVAVPSILSSKGFTSNSFSMCFGEDGVGRINFGDKGSSDQQETAFFIDSRHPSYKINMTGIVVGNSSTDMVFDAIVDSGTSFTSLADPMYTYIAENFNAQIKEKRYESESNSTFEYCYELSPGQTRVLLPVINLTTLGGSVFPVNDPIIPVLGPANQNLYCLALMKFSGVNIIGQNFLSGLHVVFDRERLVLGWKKFDCYTVDNSTALSTPSSSPSFAAAPVPSSYTQEMTKTDPNAAQVPARSPPSSYSPHSKAMSNLSPVVLLMLSLALLW
ncbi:unnamed protein product [Musa acuminata subsp. burmannicoides]